MLAKLSQSQATDSIDNLLIFIADSLRFDHLDRRVAERGVVFKAGAAATLTASSLPSIFTGQYPASHRVWNFTDLLPERPKLFGVTDNWGFSSPMWRHLEPEENPIYRLLNIGTQGDLDELDEPFVYVEHDVGGHSPYAHSLDEYNSTEFFNAHANRPEQLVSKYQAAVDASTERFLEIIDELEARGILNSTLVVFMSDHGEALGEPDRGGVYGHVEPIIPEVVYVPIVFLGAGLPRGLHATNFLSGTDIAPTALAALGKDGPQQFDGMNLWSNTPSPDRCVRSELWLQGKPVSVPGHKFRLNEYAATSLWSRNGGCITHLNSKLNRLLRGLYGSYFKRAHASVMRENRSLYKQFSLLCAYGRDIITYNEPALDQADMDQLPKRFYKQPQTGQDSARPEVDREHLKQLGYIE